MLRRSWETKKNIIKELNNRLNENKISHKNVFINEAEGDGNIDVIVSRIKKGACYALGTRENTLVDGFKLIKNVSTAKQLDKYFSENPACWDKYESLSDILNGEFTGSINDANPYFDEFMGNANFQYVDSIKKHFEKYKIGTITYKKIGRNRTTSYKDFSTTEEITPGIVENSIKIIYNQSKTSSKPKTSTKPKTSSSGIFSLKDPKGYIFKIAGKSYNWDESGGKYFCAVDISKNANGGVVRFNSNGGILMSNDNYKYVANNNSIYYRNGNLAHQSGIGGDGTTVGKWVCDEYGDIKILEDDLFGTGEDTTSTEKTKVSTNVSDVKKIDDVINNKKSIKKGNSGDVVKDIQQSLLDLGYDIGGTEPDSKFGPKTSEAVKKFQKDNGLTDDGIVGPKTAQKIKDVLFDKSKDVKNIESEKGTDYAADTSGTPKDQEIKLGESENSKPILDMMRRMNILK